MWCLVSQPNSVIMEVEVTQKAKGQECLEKVCNCLGINNESDYFGLKYHSVKGQECWLNLRNPIERQVGGVAPFRFALRVKFWVPPHLVLQDTTRHQFYLHAKMDIAEGRLKLDSRETAMKLVALISQAEMGDFEPACPPVHFYEQWCQYLLGDTQIEDSTIEKVAEMHDNVKGMKTSTAEYWLLKEISTNECYGEEIFTCKGTTLGIGPHGITIYEPQKQSIPYTTIKSAASHRRVFQLSYEQGLQGVGGGGSLLELKFDSSLAASAVYRALTEKHAFYSCETVRGAVTSQFIRDLKGTIVSIFNESTPLGKKYVFDIRRTCREVHDNARRALYQGPPPSTATSSATAPPQHQQQAANKQVPPPQHQQNSATEKLARLLDALTCRICMDANIDTVFFPCSHVICCSKCAERCQTCPLCRASIDTAKRIYLPTLEHDLAALS